MSANRVYVTLVGDLCTAADVMAKDIEFPQLEPGDMIHEYNHMGKEIPGAGV